MNKDRHVKVDHAKTPEYRQVLEQIAKEGECPAPYCKPAADYHTHPIDDTGQYWRVTQNSFNYQAARLKFLIIHKEHIEHIAQVAPEAWRELHEIMQRLCVQHEIEGATLMMRFGNKDSTGATVTHLHAHLIASYPRTAESDPILGVVGYSKPKR